MMIRLIATFIDLFVLIFNFLILVRVIMSFLMPDPAANRLSQLIYDLTEPVLAPIRRLLPGGMMIDLSPFVAFLLLRGFQALALNLLSRY
jgi:YggT family protein